MPHSTRHAPPAAFDHITSDRQLVEFCQQSAAAPWIAFDTEFVAEHTYRPQLCIVQLAVGERLAVVDAQTVADLKPLWKLLAQENHETIVHAGREELLFSIEAVGGAPARLVDVQIAAGLVGFEYPAGYGSLVAKLVGKRPHKGETRTDWRRRPLSLQQLEYALDDVRYLQPMWAELSARLAALGRQSWLDEEMAAWRREVEKSRGAHRWWRVSGISGLSRRSLAIVREVWQWREHEALRRDLPTRRVLRDDLIVELGKRRTADPKQIRAVRGMERGDLLRAMPDLAAAVQRGLDLPEDQCPAFERRESPAQIAMLGQFISSALTSICHEHQLAPSIVGTASDVRELVAHQLGFPTGDGTGPPALAQGWRAQVVGRLIEDLLSGRVAIRVRNPLSDEPLAFEPVRPSDEAR